jgi:hypothetical protein
MKDRMRPLLLFSFIVILLDGCIDPFYVPTLKNEMVVVVEGMITDQPGPYFVELSYSNNINEQLSFVNKVQQASVLLLDDHGHSELLREVTPGTYQTSETGIRGIVGNEYHIVITLTDGNVYESEPEKMLPVGKIRKVYYEFDERVPVTPDSVPPQDGLNVYIDAEVLPEQEGRVRWRTTGTSEIFTLPERRIIPLKYDDNNVLIRWILDPPACSGYVVSPSLGKLVYVRPCECCHCWVPHYDRGPILSDLFRPTSEIKKQLITFIPADPNLFFSKYHLKVEQLSASSKTFEFWKQLRQQAKTSSDLFQTPPPKLSGNIKSVNNGMRALGYFASSAMRDTSFFITRDALPSQLAAIDTVEDTCLYGSRYRTTTRPAFWN